MFDVWNEYWDKILWNYFVKLIIKFIYVIVML